MMDVSRGSQGEVVVRISGTFDAPAASQLAGWLAELSPDGKLVLDFTETRACEDLGLASLAGALGARERLVMRGLTRHQARVLRYLGWNG